MVPRLFELGTFLFKRDSKIKRGLFTTVKTSATRFCEPRFRGPEGLGTGDLCSFTHDSASGNGHDSQRGKGQSSSLAPDTKAKTDGQKPFKRSGSRGQSPWRGKGRFPCQSKDCEDPSCDHWHPPVCQNYKFETGCSCVINCRCRHVEAEEKPHKKPKTCGAEGSVASLKESFQLGCVSQNSNPRISILRKAGKLGSNHAVKFSKSSWRKIARVAFDMGADQEVPAIRKVRKTVEVPQVQVH